MWQWFLRAVQIAIVAVVMYADYDENISNGRPGIALISGVILAFGATQGLIGLKWLLVDRKRGTDTKRLNQ